MLLLKICILSLDQLFYIKFYKILDNLNRFKNWLILVKIYAIVSSFVRIDFAWRGFDEYVPNFWREYIFFDFW